MCPAHLAPAASSSNPVANAAKKERYITAALFILNRDTLGLQSGKFAHNGVLALQTHYGFYRLTVFEEDHHGDRGYVESLRQSGIFIHVDFSDFDFACVLGGHLFQDGCEHTAGAAPLCPEVYKNGRHGVINLVFEIAISKGV
jgi:hypothetical protein